jgi:hypothetical protein
MITTKTIDRLILETLRSDTMKAKAKTDEVKRLRQLKAYVELKPTEDFVRDQLKKVERKLFILSDTFDTTIGERMAANNARHEQIKKAEREFIKKEGGDVLREQIRNLNFILNG